MFIPFLLGSVATEVIVHVEPVRTPEKVIVPPPKTEKDVEARLKIANTYNALGKYCEAKESLEQGRDLEANPARRTAILDLITTIEPRCKKQMKDLGQTR